MHRFGWANSQSVVAGISNGVKPVYRLRTKAGYEVKLTADHRFLTANRGDVPACELTKDDLIVLGRGLFADRRQDEPRRLRLTWTSA